MKLHPLMTLGGDSPPSTHEAKYQSLAFMASLQLEAGFGTQQRLKYNRPGL